MKGSKPGANKALLNDADTDGRSALHIAVSNGYLDMVKLLVESGADPTLADNNGETPLSLAIAAASNPQGVEMVEVLLKSNPALITTPPLPLVSAAEAGQELLVSYLLQRGADPSGREPNGRTPIVAAICKASIPCVEQLLAAGANPNDGTIPPRIKSPLMAACSKLYGSSSICKLLLDAGANPNTAAADGWTPLHQACLDGCFSQIELLIGNGADPYQTTADGKDSFDIVNEHYSQSNSAGIRALLNGERADMADESAVWKQVSKQ
jgi:ankyrin repeat protein